MLAALLLAVASVHGTRIGTAAEARAAAGSIFDFVPAPKLFGVCYNTVNTVVRALEVMDHCAELGGRVAEAESGGYLTDGGEVCRSVVEEDAATTGASLDAYLPVESAPPEE